MLVISQAEASYLIVEVFSLLFTAYRR